MNSVERVLASESSVDHIRLEALTWINAWPTSREEKRDETTATRPLAPSVRNFSPVEHASQRVADLALVLVHARAVDVRVPALQRVRHRGSNLPGLGLPRPETDQRDRRARPQRRARLVYFPRLLDDVRRVSLLRLRSRSLRSSHLLHDADLVRAIAPPVKSNHCTRPWRLGVGRSSDARSFPCVTCFAPSRAASKSAGNVAATAGSLASGFARHAS